MIKEFRKLDPQEAEFMLKAPVLVCILIAGADGKIDRKEIREAIAIAARNRQATGILSEYLREVFSDFEDKLKIAIQGYPYETTQRTPMLVEELSAVNHIWSKLAPEFSAMFYHMLLDLAERIAASSGGWLGMHAIGPEEAQYIKLPMIVDPTKN